jgi:hypothetical protein
MNGKEKFVKAMQVNACRRCCIMKCGKKENLEYKYLESHWPKIVDAPDPTLINWQNLGYTRFNRFIRSLIVNLICFVIVMASFYSIIYALKRKEA